jgi:hypothetical protein
MSEHRPRGREPAHPLFWCGAASLLFWILLLPLIF